MSRFSGKFIQYQFNNSDAPEWLLDQIILHCHADHCTDILFTGSKFIHGPKYNKEDGKSDWDIVVYGPDVLRVVSNDSYWEPCGHYSYGESDGSAEPRFHVFRKGDLNLIVVRNQLEFERWKIASYCAKHQCVFNKTLRVELFELIHSLP